MEDDDEQLNLNDCEVFKCPPVKVQGDQFIYDGVRRVSGLRARNSRGSESATIGSGSSFFSGGLGSVWGSSRRLQVFYVIPGSGEVRHMFLCSDVLEL